MIYKFSLIVLYIILLILPVQSKHLVLPEKVVVNKEKVYLNDIFKNVDDNGVYVTTNTIPGRTKTVTKQYIRTLLKRCFNEKISLTGPEELVIEREGQKIDKSVIKEKIYKIILDKTDYPKNDMVIEFKKIRYDNFLPVGKIKYEISFKDNQEFIGNIISYIKIYVNDIYVDRMYVRVKIRVWDTVFKLVNSVSWNEKILINNVYSEKTEITHIRGTIIKDINNLKNMISKRAIPKDSIIIAENIKKEPLINRGDKIKLMSKIGNVKVSTIAIAKDYGYKNDYVRVENIKSNKIVKAKIINKNLVIIE